MLRTVVMLAGAVLAIGACADRNQYKVVDAHGWPVSTWDAQDTDYLVLRCPARIVEVPSPDGAAFGKPGDATMIVDGVSRDVVLDARQRRELGDRYCATDRGLGLVEADTDQRVVKIAIHHAPRAPGAGTPVAATSVANASSASSATASGSAPTGATYAGSTRATSAR